MSPAKKLTIAGFVLPFAIIIAIGILIMLLPGKPEDNRNKIGIIAILLPFMAAFLGAVLVGIGIVKREATEKKKTRIHSFLFGFLWTAIFHFFITICFFMLIIYGYAGLGFDN